MGNQVAFRLRLSKLALFPADSVRPLLIVSALAVARADGVISNRTAAVMFTPLWLLDLGLLCCELLILHTCPASSTYSI